MLKKSLKSFVTMGLAMTLLLGTGCGQNAADTNTQDSPTTETVKEEETTSEEAKTEELTEVEETSASDASETSKTTDEVSDSSEKADNKTTDIDLNNQLELITSNSDKWVKSEDEDYFYTLTDLDHNGRLEVIAASTQGSGMYTYLDVYEVNETKDGLNCCTEGGNFNLEEEGGIDFPDIIIDGKLITFTDGYRYVYIASNIVRVSASEAAETIDAFLLENGIFGVNSHVMKYTEGDKTTYTKCTDDSEITEEEYNNYTSDLYTKDGYTQFETTFKWTKFENDDMSEKLLECYKAFSGN